MLAAERVELDSRLSEDDSGTRKTIANEEFSFAYRFQYKPTALVPEKER